MRILTRRDTGLLTQWTFGTAGGDADALAFITAAGITDITQQIAIYTLVSDLKNYGIWTKLKALYPFVGGTASSHKFNLINPADTNAAFRLVFTGGWTHSSNGALPNGTNAWANTFFNTSTQFTTSSASFGIYSRTNDTTTRIYGTATGTSLAHHNLGSNFTAGDTASLFYTANPSTGFLMCSRTSTALLTAYRNSISLGTNTTTISNYPNLNFYIGARNSNGTEGFFLNQQHALSFMGDGLSGIESANFYTAVQAYQTTLGRQI